MIKRNKLFGILLLHLALSSALWAQEEELNINVVQIMPRLPGCEQIGAEQKLCQRQLLVDHINEHLTYPVSAIRKGVEGMVVVKALIDSTGQLTETEMVRSLFLPCDEEAVRIVKLVPEWLPAEQMGQPINEYVTVAIRFRLEDHYKKHPEHRPVFLPQTMGKNPRKKKRKQKRTIKAHD